MNDGNPISKKRVFLQLAEGSTHIFRGHPFGWL